VGKPETAGTDDLGKLADGKAIVADTFGNPATAGADALEIGEYVCFSPEDSWFCAVEAISFSFCLVVNAPTPFAPVMPKSKLSNKTLATLLPHIHIALLAIK
jgi:hypothetical protein